MNIYIRHTNWFLANIFFLCRNRDRHFSFAYCWHIKTERHRSYVNLPELNAIINSFFLFNNVPRISYRWILSDTANNVYYILCEKIWNYSFHCIKTGYIFGWLQDVICRSQVQGYESYTKFVIIYSIYRTPPIFSDITVLISLFQWIKEY